MCVCVLTLEVLTRGEAAMQRGTNTLKVYVCVLVEVLMKCLANTLERVMALAGTIPEAITSCASLCHMCTCTVGLLCVIAGPASGRSLFPNRGSLLRHNILFVPPHLIVSLAGWLNSIVRCWNLLSTVQAEQWFGVAGPRSLDTCIALPCCLGRQLPEDGRCLPDHPSG